MKTPKTLKKILALALTVIMVAASMSILAVGAAEVSAASQPTENWGKSDDGNYHITSLSDMLAFMSDDTAALTEPPFYAGATVVLDTDIDMSSVPNKKMTQFSGTFEGNGHAIKNFTADKDAVRAGFIDLLKDATIKNVRFIDGDLKTKTNRSGVVACTAQGTVTLENIYVNTPITNGVASDSDGGYYVGGLIGSVNADNAVITIKNCAVDSKLESNFMVGGLIGALEKKCTLNITDSVVAGSVISKSVTVNGNDSTNLRRSAGFVGHIANVPCNLTFTRCIMEGISIGSDGNGVFVSLRNEPGNVLKFEDCYAAIDDANRNFVGNYKASGKYNVEIKYNGSSVYSKQSAENSDAASINA
ncbi:MAG: hypothetical protein IKJ00_04140, partial [Clostridia bacterium]|nr:hypothetical protein [Clostridia bacterium]